MTKKRKRSKKNTSNRSSQFKSVKDVTHPLADEDNKTVKIIICVLLVLATFAIYSQVQDHEFINFDDDSYITNNLNVQSGFTSESVEWAFTTFAQKQLVSGDLVFTYAGLPTVWTTCQRSFPNQLIFSHS